MRRRSILPLILSLILTGCAPAVARYNQQGNAYFAAQAYDRAADAYQRAQVDDPDRAEPYYNEANTANRLQDLESVLILTDQTTKRGEPGLTADAWYNLGNAYYDAERWLDAIGAYQETLRLRPDDGQAKHNLELALRQIEQEEQQEEQSESGENESESDDGSEQAESRAEQEQPSQGDQEQPPNEPQSGSSDGQEEQPGEQPSSQQEQEPSGEPMTPAQAQQLLKAILGDSQTLQERLQELHPAPSTDSTHDW